LYGLAAETAGSRLAKTMIAAHANLFMTLSSPRSEGKHPRRYACSER
jgi:hypothetical protein